VILFKWTLLFQVPHQSLYVNFFHILCATLFTQRFNINWKKQEILLAVQIT